jgi:hypothetical protein
MRNRGRRHRSFRQVKSDETGMALLAIPPSGADLSEEILRTRPPRPEYLAKRLVELDDGQGSNDIGAVTIDLVVLVRLQRG